MEENKEVVKSTRGRKKSDDVNNVEETPEIVQQVVQETVVEEKKASRKRLNQIDVNELIPVRSLTKNKLVYISKATNARYVWAEYGDVEYLTFGEINTMRSQYPKFIKDCLVMIEDDEVIELFNLGKVYDELYSIEDLDLIFKKPRFELEQLLPALPSGIKKSIASRAKELIESEELSDYRKIQTIQDALKVDLMILLKD